MKIKFIIIVILFSLGLNSCVVSKKKYDTLNMAKQASDRKVRSLLKQKQHLEKSVDEKVAKISALGNKLQGLKEEFNNLKYDMSASNAQKSSEIDNLTKKLGSTMKDKESIKEKSAELEGDLNWLRKEKQRQAEQISQMESTIKSLENQVATLQNTKEAATNSLSANKQKIEDLTSKVNALEELLKREKATNTKLQKQLNSQPSKEAIPEN